jgi:ATP-binding cassette subfamily B protein
MPGNRQPTTVEQRPSSRNLRVLKQLLTFLRPYRSAVLGAAVALLIAAGAVLGFGVVLQRVVDHGLSSGSGTALNQALLLFLVVVTVMAASVAARVYLSPGSVSVWWPISARRCSPGYSSWSRRFSK